MEFLNQSGYISIVSIEMFLKALIFLLSQVFAYNQSQYTLGSNLILNPTFDSPNIGGALYAYFNSLPNWSCTPECQLGTIPEVCNVYGLPCTNNYTQGIDMDSVTSFNILSQTIQIYQAGRYLVSVEWMPAGINPVGKAMYLAVNSTTIFDLVCASSNVSYSYQKFQVEVDLPVGANELKMQMHQGLPPDNFGFFVTGAYVQQLIPHPTNSTNPSQASKSTEIATLETLITNPFSQLSNKAQGGRIFLRALSDHMITFDRLRFYYFHRQNLTEYSTLLLSNINRYALDQGSLCQDFIQGCEAQLCILIKEIFDQLNNGINYKQNYTDAFILGRNQKGLGFFANNLDFFFYEMPCIFLTYVVLFLLFRALFNHRISIYLRKYSFYGIFLLIVYEGNVESFTFFFFNECKNLFSANFYHKMANVFMIYFFFLLVVFSVGGLVFFYYHYRKMAKYFMEDCKQVSLEAAILESLQRSVYPLIFGSVHALLLDSLGLQTIVLGVVQTLYFLSRVYTMRSQVPHMKFKVALLMVSSMLRMVFIISFYTYQNTGYPQLINLIHYEIVGMYILCWIAGLLCDCGDLVYDIYLSIKKSCSVKNHKNDNSKIVKNKCQEKQQNIREQIIKENKIKIMKTKKNQESVYLQKNPQVEVNEKKKGKSKGKKDQELSEIKANQKKNLQKSKIEKNINNNINNRQLKISLERKKEMPTIDSRQNPLKQGKNISFNLKGDKRDEKVRNHCQKNKC